MIISSGEIDEEVRKQIIATNKMFYANKMLLKCKLRRKNCKMRISRIISQLKLMYVAKIRNITKKQEEDMRIIERKIVRTILGLRKLSETEYRSKINHVFL